MGGAEAAVDVQRDVEVGGVEVGQRGQQAHGVLLAAAHLAGHQPEQVHPDPHGLGGTRRAHAAASVSTASSAAAVRAHEKRSVARDRPAAPSRRRSTSSSRRRASASVSPATSSGSTSSAGVAGDLRGGRAGRGHHRGALGHGLEHGQAEALLEAREAEHVGAGVERPQGVGVDEADGADEVAETGEPLPQVLVPALRAGEHQLRRRCGRAARRRRAAWAGSCGARWCRSRARSGRRCRTGPAPRRPPRRRPARTSMPHGTSRRRAGSKPLRAQSSSVACDGHITRVASRRASSIARRKKLTPRRVNWPGLRRKARSWTVTTSGADGGGHGHPGGVDRRRPGRWRARRPGAAASATPRRAPAGAAAGPRTGITGVQAAGGGAPWRALTPDQVEIGVGDQGADRFERRTRPCHRARRASTARG